MLFGMSTLDSDLVVFFLRGRDWEEEGQCRPNQAQSGEGRRRLRVLQGEHTTDAIRNLFTSIGGNVAQFGL